MAAESGRCMAVYFRPLSAEKFSTPAHLRVALTREGTSLKVRIPKRRGPPLATPIRLAIGRTLPAASSITDIRSHALVAAG
jgi:hypothetical protein